MKSLLKLAYYISFVLLGMYMLGFAALSNEWVDHGSMRPIAQEIVRELRYLDVPYCARGWYDKWGTDLHYWPNGQTCAKAIGYWFNGRAVMIIFGPAIVANGFPRETTYMSPNSDNSMPSGLSGQDLWVEYDTIHATYNAQKLFDLMDMELYRQAITRVMKNYPDADARSFPKFTTDGELQPAPAYAVVPMDPIAMGALGFGAFLGLIAAAFFHWLAKNLTGGSPSPA